MDSLEIELSIARDLLRQAEQILRRLASPERLKVLPPRVWNLSVEVQRLRHILDETAVVSNNVPLPAVVPVATSLRQDFLAGEILR
jgi:hypothetical protein